MSAWDRIFIGLLAALFEILGIMLLFMAFSSTVASPKAFGSGHGLLLFAPFSDENDQVAKDSTAALKASLVNTTPPAPHVKSERADKRPDPPTPVTSEGETEKLAQDSVDVLPEKGTSDGAQSGTPSAGGGMSYDPYAGASPQFRDLNAPNGQTDPRVSPEALSLLVAVWLSGVEHNEQDRALTLVESLRADILRLNPNAKGHIAFEVLTDVSGRIIDARIKNNSAPSSMSYGARHMLIGRKTGYEHAGWHSLPLLQIGA